MGSRFRRALGCGAATLSALVAPTVAVAHAGKHEGGAGALVHVLSEPDHLLALLAILAGFVLASRAVRWLVESAKRRGETGR